MRAPELRAAGAPDAVRLLAAIRVAAIPIVFAGERLVDHPEAASGAFDELLALYGLYAVASLIAVLRPSARHLPAPAAAVIDLIAISALTYTSGGAFSQLRFAFALLPLGAAFLTRPGTAAVVSATTVAAFLAVSLPHPATEGREALEFDLVQALYLAWLGGAATGLSWLLTRRADRIQTLADSRSRLVAQALEAEERERRKLADALHDDAVQNLLAARHELDRALKGDAESTETVRLGLDRALVQLRSAVVQLTPHLLEHAGLEAALRAIGEEQGRRAGFEVELDVDGAVNGADADVAFALAREMLVNAAKHAQARHVRVRVARADGMVEVEVADDGRGLDVDRVRRAPMEGHIGLASAAERVDALGGGLAIDSRPGDGTRLRASYRAA